MLIILSQSIHANDALERREARGRAELHFQRHARGATTPLPEEVRRNADAIIHFAANSNIEGRPSDYPRVRAVLRSGVDFDKIDLVAWGRRGVPPVNVPDFGLRTILNFLEAGALANCVHLNELARAKR